MLPEAAGTACRRSVTDLANTVFPPILIVGLGVICYSSSLGGTFNFDDFPSIVKNEAIRNLSDLRSIWEYNPNRVLAYLSFALNYHVHALRPFGYHLVNLIIHLFAGLTLYGLVSSLFSTPCLREHPLASQRNNLALAVSLVFISHPVQTQAVTYVVQRIASMASLFYLLSVALYIQARLHHENHRSGHALFYAGSLITALLSMFTKEISLTLPVAILLSEYFFFSPSPAQIRRRLRYLLPMLLTLPVVPLTYLLARKSQIDYVGMATETDTIGRWDYLLTQFNVIRTYLRLLFVPVRQSVDYDYPMARHFLEPDTFLSFLLIVALLALALVLFRKYRIASFGILWFFLTLSVESSIIPIRDVIFEHRLYLPSAGIFLSAVTLIFHLLARRPRTLFALFAAVLCAASLATINRNIVWKNELLLWHDASKSAPRKARVYLNRGVGYSALNKSELALQDYDRAVERQGTHPYPYLNRGIVYLNRGEFESAVSEFNRALQFRSGMAAVYLNRGLAYMGLERYESAYEDLRIAASLEPRDPFYLNALGVVCNRVERYNLALLAFTRAIALDNRFATPFLNRGRTSRLMGRFEAAIRDLNRAAELAPEIPEIYDSRGLAHVGLSAYGEAVKDFTRAITRNPRFVEAYSNRGMSYFRLGFAERALSDLDRAVALNPSHPKLYRNRAKILQALGRDREAEADFAKAGEIEAKQEGEERIQR